MVDLSLYQKINPIVEAPSLPIDIISDNVLAATKELDAVKNILSTPTLSNNSISVTSILRSRLILVLVTICGTAIAMTLLFRILRGRNTKDDAKAAQAQERTLIDTIEMNQKLTLDLESAQQELNAWKDLSQKATLFLNTKEKASYYIDNDKIPNIVIDKKWFLKDFTVIEKYEKEIVHPKSPTTVQQIKIIQYDGNVDVFVGLSKCDDTVYLGFLAGIDGVINSTTKHELQGNSHYHRYENGDPLFIGTSGEIIRIFHCSDIDSTRKHFVQTSKPQ
jgi:hypothetical protein